MFLKSSSEDYKSISMLFNGSKLYNLVAYSSGYS
jgi:hypothetical protein